MATATPALGLPYPVDADNADVPADLQALAERVEELLYGGDALAGHVPGDVKYSVRSADHGRWLKMDGRELNQAAIESALGLDAGDAAAFVALMGTGGTSLYGAAATGKVKLLDARRSMLMAAGPTGDGSGSLTARPLTGAGAIGGVETVTLTKLQSGVPVHGHTATSPAHGHAGSTMASHTHTIPGSTYATAVSATGGGVSGTQSANHNHGLSQVTIRPGSGTPQSVVDGPDIGYESNTSIEVATHTHTIPALAIPALAIPAMTSGGPSSSALTVATTAVTVTVADHAGADAAQSHDNMPPYVTVGFGFIRV